VALLDIILTYECNLACEYCTISLEMRSRSLSSVAAVEAMRRGRASGYDAVSFTGGEPTVRRDLPALVRTARQLGYDEIKIQSNGLLFAHGANVDRLVNAGANLFHVSIQSHEESSYHRMVRREGAYPLMVAGLDNLVARGVSMRADLIITRSTYQALPNAIRWLDRHRVRRVDFWYVSLTDGNRNNIASLPRMSEALPFLAEALALARSAGMEARSLHVPRCLLGPDVGHAYDPGSDRVTVVTPDAEFELLNSRLAGRVHLPVCEGCRYRTFCPGLRPDYLAVYGDAEIAAARAGQALPAGGCGSGHGDSGVFPSS
jgi:MoaA/NifB/PqqE/SkfB family radical SAM enzyme